MPCKSKAHGSLVVPGRAKEWGDSSALPESTKRCHRTLKVEINNLRRAKIMYLNFQCSVTSLGASGRAQESPLEGSIP
eukprot:gene21511-biopygen7412